MPGSLVSLPRLVGLCVVLAVAGLSLAAPDKLTPKQPPKEKKIPAVTPGTTISTEVGVRRRLVLKDGSIVLVNGATKLSVALDKLTVTTGEIYIETGKRKADSPLVVKTADREIRATSARFGVAATKDGTSIQVTGGQVNVKDQENALKAGQVLAAKADGAIQGPRLSHSLTWTRELRTARLIPESDHAGGSLTVKSAEGQEKKLSLRRHHVDVHIEDGFARTTIDQTYFNDSLERLEGTFRFPLPPDASLNRLAMYVDGVLMEGGMLERQRARTVYERIRDEQADPALLEWVDGSTFKMRIFPLEPRQEKRVFLSYTQKLPSLYGQTSYRFPAGHSLNKVNLWSFKATIIDGQGLTWKSPSHQLTAEKDGKNLILKGEAKDARLDRDIVLHLTQSDKTKPDDTSTSFATMKHDKYKYLMVRYRPGLKADKETLRRDWVVLVETSGDRDPVVARTQIDLVKNVLAHAGPEDTFQIITAWTRTRAITKSQAITPANLEEALAQLEKAHLIGALDLGKAFTEIKPLLEAAKAPYLLHVGSGTPAMGTRSTPELLKRLPKGVRYVGVGVGKRWNRPLMQTLAEKTGGYFTQVNPDEQVSWRGLDLAATLYTPRLLDVTVTAGKVSFLPFVRLAAQGEEIAAICRISSDEELPAKVTVKGILNGEPFTQEVEVKDARDKAAYLPRAWAKLEIDRLLAEDGKKHKKAIIALSMDMYVMTPYTSLLVLENDDMYERFKVSRDRKENWALYGAPKKIAVVKEVVKDRLPTQAEIRKSIVVRQLPKVLEVMSRGRSVSTTAPAAGNLNAPPRPKRGTDKKAAKDENVPDSATPVPVNEPTDTEKSDPGDNKPDLSNPDLGVDPDWNGPRVDDPRKDKDYSQRPYDARTAKADESLTIKRADVTLKDRLAQMIARGPLSPSLLYSAPRYTDDEAVFSDLLAYAPGLNTLSTDIDSILEAEARPNLRGPASKSDDASAKRFAAARGEGWRTLSVPAAGILSAYKVTFDGTGKFLIERTLTTGLKETLYCDGKSLYHVYPELGLAAKRTMSRAYRVAIFTKLPWLVPPATDLAHGADLADVKYKEDEKDEAETAVSALTPNDNSNKKPKTWTRTEFTFVKGRLSERRLVTMPKRVTVWRETIAEDGTFERFDAEGKKRWSKACKLEKSKAPAFKLDKDLVVLDLPFRTVDHVRKTLKIEKKTNAQLTFKEATALLVAMIAERRSGEEQYSFRYRDKDIQGLYLRALAARDQNQLGYFVLLAAAGVDVSKGSLDVTEEYPDEPLAQYLALFSSPLLRRQASRYAANNWSNGLLHRLAQGHALLQRWESPRKKAHDPIDDEDVVEEVPQISSRECGQDDDLVPQQPEKMPAKKAERDAFKSTDLKRALAYAKKFAGTPLAWALLGRVQDRLARQDVKKAEIRAAWGDLAGAYAGFEKSSRFKGYAGYERARCLLKAGKAAEARKLFVAWHEQLRKGGQVPMIDADFRSALLAAEKEETTWAALMKQTAGELTKANNRDGLIHLAWQAWALDDRALSGRLMDQALKGVTIDDKNLPTLVTALEFQISNKKQMAKADQLLQTMLKNAALGKSVELWNLAARVAGHCDRPDRELEYREKAVSLALEQGRGHTDAVVSLCQDLLEDYGTVARSLRKLKIAIPKDLTSRVVRAADTMRGAGLQTRACARAAAILALLGEHDLAWDYRTTPLAITPGESAVWAKLASDLSRHGSYDQADLAYASAFEIEPTNAQYLWDRAENLRNAGRLAAAKKLYTQLAESEWLPRFANLKEQAGELAKE